VNDVFEINVNDIASYSISIYDRWGQEIFNSTNPALPWDGKTKGATDAPAGVYYYTIQSICKDGRSNKKQGFVQLIR
jgi:gliding motility-associated-like protein